MKTILKILVFKTLMVCSVLANAQGNEVKFGDVPLNDLKMDVYPLDSNAAALVLSDIGTCQFSYNTGTKEWQLYFDRHIRIKILSEEGFDQADFRVPLYNDGSMRESLSGLKGFTFNMEDGRVAKEKFDKKTTMTEKTSENWSAEIFTMPNVKVGSVIDVEYRVISDYIFHMQPWYFQSDIPIRWSEYTVKYPEYYDYKLIFGGYHPLVINDYTTENRSVTLSNGRSTGQVNYIENSYHWAAKDVPAFRDEAFITTEEDYLSKIEFELASISPQGQLQRTFMKDWPDINHDLMESSKFGLQIKRTAIVKEEVEHLRALYTDDFEYAMACVQHLKDHMSFDDTRRFSTEVNVRDAYIKKIGSSADINLLLVGMLREGGLNANPVITSTRNHGRVHPVYPMLSKFNNVMAHVVIGEKEMVLDATTDLLPPNMLPILCQTEQGRLISETGSRWVSVYNGEEFKKAISVEMELDENAAASGTLNYQLDGYSAYMERSSLLKDGDEKHKENIKKKFDSWEISDITFESVNSPAEVLKKTISFSTEDQAEIAGNLIYLTPLIVERKKENPFKHETRNYPVDFIAPRMETVSMTIALPEGYEVEEIPQPLVMSLPDGSCKFIYNISPVGNKLQVVSRLMIKKSIYLPDEYPLLKQFFDQIVAKQAEQVVIKRSI